MHATLGIGRPSESISRAVTLSSFHDDEHFELVNKEVGRQNSWIMLNLLYIIDSKYIHRCFVFKGSLFFLHTATNVMPSVHSLRLRACDVFKRHKSSSKVYRAILAIDGMKNQMSSTDVQVLVYQNTEAG